MDKRLIKFMMSCFFLAFLLYCHSVYAAEDSRAIVQMVSPLPHSEIIAKKPQIRARFTAPVDRGSLLILLDDSDITALAQVTEDGFQCRSPQLLLSGSHMLTISGNSAQGPFEIQVEFSSRHSAMLDEIYTTNEWNLNAQASNYHSNTADDFSMTHVDSTLNHQSVVKKGDWDMSFIANVRYLEQSRGVEEPERKGFDIHDFLIRTHYQHEIIDAAFEFGDLQLEESKNTFESLSRHGGKFDLTIGNFYANAFSVFSWDTYGVHDGSGIGFNDDKYLRGVSGGVKLLDDRIDIKSFYFKGGQRHDSFSTWSQEEGNQGDIYGFVLNSDLLQRKLTTEFEYDVSDFDPDISDNNSSESDKAYRVELGSEGERYSCGAWYKYFGPDYDLPGNLSPQKDYRGASVFGNLNFDVQSFGVVVAHSYDNVDSDYSSYARTTSDSGELTYSYNGFTSFPITLGYQRSKDKSSHEPSGGQETDLTTDTISAGIGYNGPGIFSVNFSGQYSRQNDKSDQDQDTRTTSVSISPTLSMEFMTISVSSGLTRYKDLFADTTNDNYTFTLDVQGTLFQDVISYNLGGTYDQTLTDVDQGDGNNFSGYGRLAYALPFFHDLLNPTLGVDFTYNRAKQESTDAQKESLILGTLTTSMPFSF